MSGRGRAGPGASGGGRGRVRSSPVGCPSGGRSSKGGGRVPGSLQDARNRPDRRRSPLRNARSRIRRPVRDPSARRSPMRVSRSKLLASALGGLLACACAWLLIAAAPASALDGDYVVHGFRFASGDTLGQLRLHYLTLGQPRKDTRGNVTNGVLIMHGTGGTGRQFMSQQFASV